MTGLAEHSDKRPPTWKDFFPLPLPPNRAEKETDTDICRDITLLSTLLKNHRPETATYFWTPHQTKHSRSEPNLWSYVSYILASGRPLDNYHDDVVPVVGRLEPGAITATVFAPNTSPRYSNYKHEFPVQIDRLELDPEVGKQRLGNPDEPDRTNDVNFFDTHLNDVMSVISYLLSLSADDKKRRKKVYATADLFDFIVMRCYRKLYARIDSGTTLWLQHPLKALSEFYDKESPMADTQDSSVSVEMPQLYTYRNFLEMYSIAYFKTQSPLLKYYVTFSSSTAPAWAKLLHHCFKTMQYILCTKRPGVKPKPRRPADNVERRRLHAILALLDDVTDSEIIKRLFPAKLVVELKEQYDSYMKERSNTDLTEALKRPNPENPGAGATTDDEPTTSDKPEFDADDLQAGDEESLEHIVRHIRSLALPLRAASYLVDECYDTSLATKSIEVFRVNMRPTPLPVKSEYSEYFDRFAERFAERCGEDRFKVVKQALRDLKTDILTTDTSIHAGAALMSLLSGDLQSLEVPDDNTGTLTSVSSLLPFDDRIPIGVSKRCCFCCWLLADLLKPGSAAVARSQFVLSGMHSTIFPWVPPHGVPRNVLLSMRERLLATLREAVISCVKLPRSAQTSPAKSVRWDHAEDDLDTDEESYFNTGPLPDW